ncbi:MAG: hypothetical protein R2764_04105 [Bacteroidales bacterium]
MKTFQFTKTILLSVLLCCTVYAFSQQTIHTIGGDEIGIKKWKIAPKFQIKYKLSDKSSSGFQFIDLKDIYYINDKKGNGIAFQEKGKNFKIKKVSNLSKIELQGAVDACKYSRQSGAYWGTWVPSFLFMPVGLGTAIVVSSTKPNQKSLNMPDSELVNDPVYVQSYKKQARKNKSQMTWMGFTLGFSLALAVGGLIAAL